MGISLYSPRQAAVVEVHNLPGAPFPCRVWRGWLASMLEGRYGSGPRFGVRLVLIRDGLMAAINRAHLGVFGPTNVLSFPSGVYDECSPSLPRMAPETPPVPLGELYLSIDTLKREAFLYGQSQEDHARTLLAHGLAHLLGYDHGQAMDAVWSELMRHAERTSRVS